jgi:hypothetical protein
MSGKLPGARASRTKRKGLPAWGWSLIALAALVPVLLLVGSVAAAVLQPWEPETSVASDAARLAGSEQQGERRERSGATPTSTSTPEVTTREEVVTEVIPFGRTSVEDAALPRGQQSITAAGQDGERRVTYVLTLEDGVEIGRELASDVVTREPITEVTAIGVQDSPPPPAAPACHASYTEACVPVASDVDCAWGSGDGPAYLDGVARVVGPDVYDLDRNDDGWACER